ncbi:MAG: hypothetical protein FWE98_05000 [Oscillospiraceae bacterium]|nr:hypothetical protein [Oscillospiraceae bacterium]
MNRTIAILLALAMLGLFACGRTEPEPTTTVPTTEEIETTTEAETAEAPTTVFVPMSGEENGVKWRTLDLEDEENAEIKAWLDDWYLKWEPYPFSTPKPIQLSKTKTVYRKEDAYREGKLILRDETTGKETLLLEDTYYGESDIAKAIDDETSWKRPIPVDTIDERYIVVLWGGWSWQCGVSVYDIKEMREVPVKNDTGYMGNYFRTIGNHIYLNTPGDDGGYYGSLSLQRAVVTSEMGEILIAVELLNDYPNTDDIDVQWLGWCELSPDERHYITHMDGGALICDMKETKPAWRIPFPEGQGFSETVFRDTNTVYFISGDQYFDNDSNVISVQIKRYVFEITLP